MAYSSGAVYSVAQGHVTKIKKTEVVFSLFHSSKALLFYPCCRNALVCSHDHLTLFLTLVSGLEFIRFDLDLVSGSVLPVCLLCLWGSGCVEWGEGSWLSHIPLPGPRHFFAGSSLVENVMFPD